MEIKQVYDKCMAGKERTEYTIVGTRLGTFTLCPTKLYLDYHGPQEKKLPTHEFLLKKIEDGKYGICESTGEQIPIARLEANPAAKTCMEHLEK